MTKPGLKYSHTGIPTDSPEGLSIYLEEFKIYINDFNESPYAVEWLYFEKDSPFPEILKTKAHVAYECDDIEEAMKAGTVLVPPFDAGPGLKCAFIEVDGHGVELMQRS
ncbi:MAG: VOC family protein [Thermoguttaceae bacterium]|jgi:hypothetical protein